MLLQPIAAWKKLGTQVSSFKKGPDYIDAGWLALAAGRPCYNLDTFLIEKEHVLNSFLIHSKNSDISVIEGNRGLYDGIDLEFSGGHCCHLCCRYTLHVANVVIYDADV